MDFWQNLQPLFLLKCFGYVMEIFLMVLGFPLFFSGILLVYFNNQFVCRYLEVHDTLLIYIWNMGPSFLGKLFYICMSDILFRQITTFMKVCVAFAFGKSIDFTLKNGLEPKNKGHTNFYECCDLTKKYI